MASPSTAAQDNQPLRTTPMPALPHRFGDEEMAFLKEAMDHGSLFYRKSGGLVEQMTAKSNEVLGSKYTVACSSGTAAIHIGVASCEVKPGDEVITSPITDMGTAIAILYQNAVPVFADVDPHTYNMTAESIEARITPRTSAVVLVHLAGGPADLDAILDLCQRKGLPLVEDCAQSWGCRYRGRHVGTFGAYGCMSLNDFKHLSCGDGGLVLTQDETRYYHAHNYADKYCDRHSRGPRFTRLAPNYRMTELQGAVTLAQLDRLNAIAAKRRALGDQLSELLKDIPGITPHKVVEGGECSYWFYMLRMDPKVLGIDRNTFAERASAEGIHAGAGYLARPLHHEPVFANKSFFAGGIWPAEVISGQTYDYSKMHCPVTEDVLATAIRMPLHQGMEPSDIEDIAAVYRKVVRSLIG